MKRLCVAALTISLLLSGCGPTGFLCTKLTPDELSRAQGYLNIIQQNYATLQGLVASIPTAGPIIAAAAPVALALADTALASLGTMLKTNCVDSNQLAQAQVAAQQIQSVVQSAPVQKFLMTHPYPGAAK